MNNKWYSPYLNEIPYIWIVKFAALSMFICVFYTTTIVFERLLNKQQSFLYFSQEFSFVLF